MSFRMKRSSYWTEFCPADTPVDSGQTWAVGVTTLREIALGFSLECVMCVKSLQLCLTL